MTAGQDERDLNRSEEEEKLAHHIVNTIREKSREGFLLSMREICEEIERRKPGIGEGTNTESDARLFLDRVMKKNDDLKKILDQEGNPHYYSSQFMSETYAKILIRKKGDPLSLISDTVRENSSVRSRPVPIATFLESPFHLSQEEIALCLERMAGDNRYRDIGQTVTSIGTYFLYSTLYLEPGYASMLSEWMDVGYHENP